MILFELTFVIVKDYFRFNSDHERRVQWCVLAFLIVKDYFRINRRQERSFCTHNKEYDRFLISILTLNQQLLFIKMVIFLLYCGHFSNVPVASICRCCSTWSSFSLYSHSASAFFIGNLPSK